MVPLTISRDSTKNRNRNDAEFSNAITSLNSQLGVVTPSWYDENLYGRLMQALLDRGVPPNEARMLSRESFLSGHGRYNFEWANNLGVSEAAISESSKKASDRRNSVGDLYHMMQETRMKDVLTTFSGQYREDEQVVEVRVCEYLSYNERFEKNIEDYENKPHFAVVFTVYDNGIDAEFSSMKIERFDTPTETCVGVLNSDVEWNQNIIEEKLSNVFGEEIIKEAKKS